MNPLRIVFAGTPMFAVPALQALARSGNQLLAAYTQPDRPAGRGRQLTGSPVKLAAQEFGLPICQPLSLKPQLEQERMRAWKPDLMVVVAYGLILPQAVLDIPRLGCLNMHASLLPRWRGAAPIQRAILSGDDRTGVSLMQMDAGLDTGPVYACAETEIRRGETSGHLHDRLAQLGADTLLQHLPAIAAGRLQPLPQDEYGVTYAAKLTKAEARIDWSLDAVSLEHRILGLNPWPMAETTLQGQMLRIWQAHAVSRSAQSGTPGMVVAASSEGIDVLTGNGFLRLTVLQKAGGRPLPADQFLRGFDLLGRVLGT